MRLGSFIFLICFLSRIFYSCYSSAQVADSIGKAMKQKPKFIINLDTRNSFITNTHVKFFGIKAGFDFGQLVKMGFGYHFLETPLYRTAIVDGGNGANDTVVQKLNMGYAGCFIEYVYNRTGRWSFSIPLEIGIGSSHYEYRLAQQPGKSLKSDKRIIALYEPAVAVQYRIMRWAGLGMGLGYRIMLINNKAVNEKMTSPIYIFRLKIFTGEIYRAVFPRR